MAAGDKIVLPNHGEDHCPGGPDPIPCLGSTSSIELSAITATAGGGLDIPANTWEDMVSVAQSRKFTYAFDSDGVWSFSNTTGIVERDETAAYQFFASVDWQSISPGDTMGVAIRMASAAYWWRNVITLDGGAGGSAARVSVTGQIVTNLFAGGANNARAFVYCNPAATITRAEFIVRRFEPVSGGTEYSF